MSVVFGYLALCFIWGTSWVAIKFSLQGFPPFLGAALRFSVASLLLFGYAHWRSIPLTPPRKSLRAIVLTAFLLYVIDYGLIYWSEQYLSAGVTAIFFSTFPLFTGVFANFLFRSERFRFRVQAGLALGFAGVLVIFEQELLQTRFEPFLAAAAFGVLISAAAGAISSLIVKQRLTDIDPVSLSLQQMVLGALALFAIGLASGETGGVHFSGPALLAVLYLGLAASALAFVLYYWLLQKLSAITLSLVVFVIPSVAVLFDWLLLGQTLSRQTAIGMLIILGGVGLSMKKGPTPRSQSGGAKLQTGPKSELPVPSLERSLEIEN